MTPLLPSIRVGTSVKALVFRDANYAGTTDTLTGNIADLNSRPMTNNSISSAKVQWQSAPTNTPTPTATPSGGPTNTPTSPPPTDTGWVELLGPFLSNGGFESANMSGWTQFGGSFDVTQDFVRSGNWSVRGTSATKAHFIDWCRSTNTVPGSMLATARPISGLIFDPGNSENGRVIVTFRDQAGNDLGGGYEAAGLRPVGKTGAILAHKRLFQQTPHLFG